MSKFFSLEFKFKRFLKLLGATCTIILALLLCPITYIEKDFREYHEKYMMFVESMCKTEQLKYPWQFAMIYHNFSEKNGEKKAGETTSSNRFFNQRLVMIDEYLWKHGNENYRVSLAFHELTHAYFGYPDLRDPWFKDHFMFYYSSEQIDPFTVYKQLMDLLYTDLCKP